MELRTQEVRVSVRTDALHKSGGGVHAGMAAVRTCWRAGKLQYRTRQDCPDGSHSVEPGRPSKTDRLIIIDPALTAFVGEANSPTQAMAFLDALSSEARQKKARGCSC